MKKLHWFFYAVILAVVIWAWYTDDASVILKIISTLGGIIGIGAGLTFSFYLNIKNNKNITNQTGGVNIQINDFTANGCNLWAKPLPVTEEELEATTKNDNLKYKNEN